MLRERHVAVAFFVDPKNEDLTRVQKMLGVVGDMSRLKTIQVVAIKIRFINNSLFHGKPPMME